MSIKNLTVCNSNDLSMCIYNTYILVIKLNRKK